MFAFFVIVTTGAMACVGFAAGTMFGISVKCRSNECVERNKPRADNALWLCLVFIVLMALSVFEL